MRNDSSTATSMIPVFSNSIGDRSSFNSNHSDLAQGVGYTKEQITQITQKMKALLELIIQKKDGENLSEVIYNNFMITEPRLFVGKKLTKQGLEDFFKNPEMIKCCKNAQNSSGILYIKDNKSAEFLETIGLIILAKINYEETSLVEDSIKLSLTQCVEELKDMRLVEQPHPTSVVPLLQNLSKILSL